MLWWKSQPRWDLSELDDTTSMLEEYVARSQNRQDPTMARIEYEMLEDDIELRETPLGNPLKYWDP